MNTDILTRVSTIDPRPIDDGFTGYTFSKAPSLAPTVKGERRRRA